MTISICRDQASEWQGFARAVKQPGKAFVLAAFTCESLPIAQKMEFAVPVWALMPADCVFAVNQPTGIDPAKSAAFHVSSFSVAAV